MEEVQVAISEHVAGQRLELGAERGKHCLTLVLVEREPHL